MILDNLNWFFYCIIFFWLISIFTGFFPGKGQFKEKTTTFSIIGVVFLGIFLFLLWLEIKRPPMRTLGETRLWYSFFLPMVGLISYYRWKFKWIVPYSTFVAMVFLVLNFFKPENFERSMMPALQSPWFVPHVILFIFSYSLLGAAAIIGIREIYSHLKNQSVNNNAVKKADNLIYVGLSMFTIALLFGALWAKEAWGHYWTWDPKETWAFITWMIYIIYIHYRIHRPRNTRVAVWMLFLSFFVLLICWFGVNYLPSSINSIHVYTD